MDSRKNKNQGLKPQPFPSRRFTKLSTLTFNGANFKSQKTWILSPHQSSSRVKKFVAISISHFCIGIFVYVPFQPSSVVHIAHGHVQFCLPPPDHSFCSHCSHCSQHKCYPNSFNPKNLALIFHKQHSWKHLLLQTVDLRSSHFFIISTCGSKKKKCASVYWQWELLYKMIWWNIWFFQFLTFCTKAKKWEEIKWC